MSVYEKRPWSFYRLSDTMLLTTDWAEDKFVNSHCEASSVSLRYNKGGGSGTLVVVDAKESINALEKSLTAAGHTGKREIRLK